MFWRRLELFTALRLDELPKMVWTFFSSWVYHRLLACMGESAFWLNNNAMQHLLEKGKASTMSEGPQSSL
jgi:hypothetical protein